MKRRNFLQALIGALFGWFGIKTAAASACGSLSYGGYSFRFTQSADVFTGEIIRNGFIEAEHGVFGDMAVDEFLKNTGQINGMLAAVKSFVIRTENRIEFHFRFVPLGWKGK
jgi:hypothetical protein